MRVLIFKKKNSICLGDIEKSAGENIRMVKVVSRDTPPFLSSSSKLYLMSELSIEWNAFLLRLNMSKFQINFLFCLPLLPHLYRYGLVNTPDEMFRTKWQEEKRRFISDGVQYKTKNLRPTEYLLAFKAIPNFESLSRIPEFSLGVLILPNRIRFVFNAVASLPRCHEVTILYFDRMCDDLTERIDMFQETPFSTQRYVVNESQVLRVLVETNSSAMGYYGHVESIQVLA